MKHDYVSLKYTGFSVLKAPPCFRYVI